MSPYLVTYSQPYKLIIFKPSGLISWEIYVWRHLTLSRVTASTLSNLLSCFKQRWRYSPPFWFYKNHVYFYKIPSLNSSNIFLLDFGRDLYLLNGSFTLNMKSGVVQEAPGKQFLTKAAVSASHTHLWQQRDFAWINRNALSHSSHTVYSPGQMCRSESFITLCALSFHLWVWREFNKERIGCFPWIYCSFVSRIKNTLLMHWKMGMRFAFGGWVRRRREQKAEVIAGCSVHKWSLIFISCLLHP